MYLRGTAFSSRRPEGRGINSSHRPALLASRRIRVPLARFTAPPNMVNSAVHTGAEAISHLAIKNNGSWVWVSPVRAFFPKPLRRTDLIRLPLSLAAWRRNGCPGRRLLAAGHLMPGVNGSGLGCIDGTERAQQQSVRSGRVQLRVESPNEQVCGTL